MDARGDSRGGEASRRNPAAPEPRPAAGANPDSLFGSVGIELMPSGEFKRLSGLIARHFGIKVGANKLTLVTGRIQPIMAKYGFGSYRTLLDALENDREGELISELANHISTNHTSFYREEAHFKLLMTTVLPEIERRKRAAGDFDIRVWCAACSTGEEAYSIQFCLLRHFGADYGGWKAGVLATDISATALEKARAGVYPVHSLSALPPEAVLTFFRPVDAEHYEIAPEVKREVTFRRLNLTRDAFPLKKAFDIIFCRNVMIYFGKRTRSDLIDRLGRWLAPDGYLFIGHSETIPDPDKRFRHVAPCVYTPRKG